MLRYTLDCLYKSGLVLASVSMVLICLLMTMQIVGRWFGLIVPSVEDFVGYFLASATFFALAYSFRHNSHIRVTFLTRQVKGAAQRYVELFNLTALLILVGFITYAVGAFVLETYEFNDVSSGYIAVPLWMPQSVMLAGLALFFIAVLDDWITALLKRKPSYVAAQEAGEAAAE
ncbi:TRAP transporter small permease [Hahella sp. CR1]|uniref:TRAP transporter small permease n=1 Tax=Hahella sp. CR1 TaxID=2992807 RepID=UPI00244341DC|nr:TRAP transporter small permease [Hahella sp. CR1]MDG9667027.1 TRAP transporter small permease [Hahella sp. CR1]